MNNISKNWKSLFIYLLIPIMLIGSVFFFAKQQSKTDMKYSQIVSMFRNDEIKEYTLDLSSGSLVYSTFKEPKKEQNYTVPNVSIFLDDVTESVDEYNLKNPDNQIVYDYKAGRSGSILINILPTLISVLLIAGLGYMLYRSMSNAANSDINRSMSFGKIRPKSLISDEKRKTTFGDVAGCEEEKDELEELVDFLKEPERFTKLGARIPKGVLLVGPPGTGKTLLARAVAGEAGAPFLSISGSDFVEMYVGVGASRVRDLFEQAKKNSPAIIFIDEIDAVGRHRGAGMGGGHDEREQTLNQLLVEMDGFGTNEGVIVMAATNRPDVLDPALLRPGRFDRQVTVGRPDTQGREDILKIHARNKPLAPDVDLKDVAKTTIGLVGADLENVMNEAALLAARRKRHAITNDDIQDAITRVEMGTEKKSHKYSEKAKKLTAYHESGHAVVSYYLEYHDPVKEISIIPRGMGAGGYTMYQPQEENYDSKNEMLDLLVSMLGGRVAEALTMGDISTGASNDIKRVSQIAREMVTKYGMSESLGPINYGQDNEEVFIGRDYGHIKNYSEETAAKIDEEVSRIINRAYERAEAILKEHIDILEIVANTLIEREKLDMEQFKKLVETGSLDDEKAEEEPTENPETQASETEEESEPQEVDSERVQDEIPDETTE